MQISPLPKQWNRNAGLKKLGSLIGAVETGSSDAAAERSVWDFQIQRNRRAHLSRALAWVEEAPPLFRARPITAKIHLEKDAADSSGERGWHMEWSCHYNPATKSLPDRCGSCTIVKHIFGCRFQCVALPFGWLTRTSEDFVQIMAHSFTWSGRRIRNLRFSWTLWDSEDWSSNLEPRRIFKIVKVRCWRICGDCGGGLGVAMAVPWQASSLALMRDIPTALVVGFRGARDNGAKVDSRCLERDSFVMRSGSQRQESTLREGSAEENMTHSLENWRVEMVDGMKWAFNFALTSICCYGVAAAVSTPDIETWRIRGSPFFDVPDVLNVGTPSAHASGLLQMPPVRLVNR